MLSTPVSNAWPVRGASCVKRVKTRFPSTLKNDMLQFLLQVSINGPANGTNDSKGLIERSVKAWSSAKNRRQPRARQDTADLQSESHLHVFVEAGVQTDQLEGLSEEMQRTDCVREVDAFYKACDLPDVPDDLINLMMKALRRRVL